MPRYAIPKALLLLLSWSLVFSSSPSVDAAAPAAFVTSPLSSSGRIRGPSLHRRSSKVAAAASDHGDNDDDGLSSTTTRRNAIQQAARSILATTAAVSLSTTGLPNALAVEAVSSDVSKIGNVGDDGALPPVTHKVYMDVRISRSDGTFYVRDAPSDGTVDEQPFYGQIVLGLFGTAKPVHVAKFLSYVDVKYDVDDPLPSYSRGRFNTLDSSTGLLAGGTIPGLEATSMAGGNVIRYGSRVIPAGLWIETKQSGAGVALTHATKGMLTHRNLDLTPAFGMTTRNNDRTAASVLDGTHTIFGCVLSSEGFLDAVVDLPALTADGKVTTTSSVVPEFKVGGKSAEENRVLEGLASSVFTAQRKVFRGAAKSIGDSRLDKVYDGKLLRRVEVTKVGILE